MLYVPSREVIMSETPGTPTILSDRRFTEMSFNEKLVFIGKAAVFLASGGFIYPTIWID